MLPSRIELLALLCLCSLAAAEKRPNVVLLVSDQWRHDWTSADTPGLRTPTFDRVVAQGTRFSRAIVPSPLCNPSRASLATGLTYPKHGVLSSDKSVQLPDSHQTIYQLLRDSGVWTMTTGKDDLTLLGPWRKGEACGARGSKRKHICGEQRSTQLGFEAYKRCYGKDFARFFKKPVDPYMWSLSLDEDDAQLFQRYIGSAKQSCKHFEGLTHSEYTCPNATDFPQEEFIDNWIAEQAMGLIRGAPAEKPFFLQVNYAGPHPPFIVTESMRSGDGWGRTWPLAFNSSTLKPEVQQLMRSNYAALIENIEGLNQQILDTIEARGELNNTVVCMLSDHGEMLGDFWDISTLYEPLQKSAPWQASIAVPMACMGPGIQKGRVIEDPVSTMDLASTVLELQGTSVPRHFDSVSLRDTLAGGELESRPVVSGMEVVNHMFSTAIQKFADGHVWKFVCCIGACPFGLHLREGAVIPQGGYVRRLYDLTADPLELNDLYEEHPFVAAKLVEALRGAFDGCGSVVINGTYAITPTGDVISADTHRHFDDKGAHGAKLGGTIKEMAKRMAGEAVSIGHKIGNKLGKANVKPVRFLQARVDDGGDGTVLLQTGPGAPQCHLDEVEEDTCIAV